MTTVGLMLAPQGDPAEVVGAARRAEELGYDFLACGEHVFFHSPTPNAFVSLAAAAGATSRIRLLSALTILPMYPAALAAKMAATLDRVSGGRFDLGIGVGGEFPAEFAAVDVPVTLRGRRTDESLDVMTRLFAGERVSFGGHEVALDPLPLQRPRPPLWIGGRKEASMRRAGRFGDVWVPYMYSPEQLAAGLATVAGSAAEHGRSGVEGAVFCWTGAGRDGAAARRGAVETLGAVYRQDFAPIAGKYVPSGTPEQVVARLREYVDAGARSIVLVPACPDAERAAMVELFAREIAPALQIGSPA
ncbi:LLM class flavin-dependent oxidoreductase [Pseudonocardia sp.]|uniref:LLM class flavin-dependent oxidoreductase n=1 Tax=Pseudonocardia sp. TaxID=60912 RepID=UPI002631B33A|nr:LLM class flavin-dependent oxidoreductase [Pseudonocardia sp.]